MPTRKSIPGGHAANPLRPQKLPSVQCVVRARIPTTTGHETWLHLYHNDADDKEHLAVVFGDQIRSRSLDALWPGESERDRMIRGAYTGTLYPGRLDSRACHAAKDTATGSRHIATRTLKLPSSSRSTEDATSNPRREACGLSEELESVLVRVHSECFTGETAWSARCDCGEQLQESARLMSLPAHRSAQTQECKPGGTRQQDFSGDRALAGGVIIYLRQEGRGIGLEDKLKAYNLQDLGFDTVEANLLLHHPSDARSYDVATSMLLDLGLGRERGIRLLTNSPDKVQKIQGPQQQIRVVERIPMTPLAWKTNGEVGVRGPEVEKYLATKIAKLKHMLDDAQPNSEGRSSRSPFFETRGAEQECQ